MSSLKGWQNMKPDNLILYGITEGKWLEDDRRYEKVEQALKGGVSILQMREKNLDEDTFVEEAIKVRKICEKYGVPLIINDNVKVALRSGADGVHLGQKDMGVKEARAILGGDKIIGASARSVELAVKAMNEGADYLGTGAAFGTNTKMDAITISHETIKEICSSVNIPVVAIGGITKDNIPQLAGRGIAGVATVSAIFGADDIENECRILREISERTVKA